MARTCIRLEGGREGAPATIFLENDRLAVTLQREGETYFLASLRAGGDFELLAEPSPVLSCFDGKESLAVPFDGATAEDEGGVARVRFAAVRGPLSVEVMLTLAPGRPFLELVSTFHSEEDWHGLIYTSCAAHSGFLPTAYPWIAGDVATDRGFAWANCMGAPLLAGDPRGGQGHILALGFPLSESYRDLFFHYDPETRRLAAGLGEGRSRPPVAAPVAPGPGPAARRLPFLKRPVQETPPKTSPLALRIPYRAGEPYRLWVQIWALTGEHRNLAGEWIKGNGFSFQSTSPRPVDESLRLTLEFLREGAPFIEGKGYPMRAARYTKAPGAGEGGRIHVYGNAALACALYGCWARFREEWMRERALALVDFVLSAQRANGLIPEVFDPATRKWGSLGAGFHYDGAGLCMDALLRLQQARREAEGTDDFRLRRAVLAFMGLFLDERRLRMERERKKGLRRHDQETTFPYSGADNSESANINLLIVLERLRQTESERRFEIVREDGEKWLLHNVLHQMSWRGGDPLRPGLEARSLLRCLEYAVLRHEATQGKRYLDMAEMLASYFFLTLVPKELEWCSGRTRGLAIAGSEWRALTVGYEGCVAPTLVLRRLGKLTNDRFYAHLGDHLVRAGMVAQCDEKGVPGCGGWLPALNSPDANAFVLNGVPDDGELAITSVVPTVLETYLGLLNSGR